MTDGNHLSAEIEDLRDKIMALKNYISCLYKRLSLIKSGFSAKSNYEKNEIELKIHETKYLLSAKISKCNKLEEELAIKVEELNKLIDEVGDNYESLLHTIMNFHQDNLKIKDYLYPINWKKTNDNLFLKMEIYFKLKELLGTPSDKNE